MSIGLSHAVEIEWISFFNLDVVETELWLVTHASRRVWWEYWAPENWAGAKLFDVTRNETTSATSTEVRTCGTHEILL